MDKYSNMEIYETKNSIYDVKTRYKMNKNVLLELKLRLLTNFTRNSCIIIM